MEGGPADEDQSPALQYSNQQQSVVLDLSHLRKAPSPGGPYTWTGKSVESRPTSLAELIVQSIPADKLLNNVREQLMTAGGSPHY